jgi:DNA-binding NarL/FixJ family response regulator
MAAHSRGAVALADGQAGDALIALRRALSIWKDLDAPYEVARVRLLVGLACRALRDYDTASLELEAARRAFKELGAAPDQARADSLVGPTAVNTGPDDARGVTARELQVLRLIAAGKSNREIADELFISEHTVARHVQNIFAKLDVSSRAAATAFAFSHNLV